MFLAAIFCTAVLAEDSAVDPSLKVDLGAVDSEDAPAMPTLGDALAVEGLRRELMEHVPQKIDGDLRPSRAERRRLDWLLGGQRQTVAPSLVPERVEQVLVAATATVSDHVQEQRDQELRLEGPASCEVARVAAELTLVCGRESAGNERKEFATMRLTGTKICSWRSRSRQPSFYKFFRGAARPGNRAALRILPFARDPSELAAVFRARVGACCKLAERHVAARGTFSRTRFQDAAASGVVARATYFAYSI